MALHRFVHIGDLHLGPNERNADRMAALAQIVTEQLREPVAAWLIPGDLNHGRMTIPDKNFLTGMVQRMAEHAPVVICYGNHDLPGDLDFLAKIGARWPIYVIDRPEVIRIRIATSDALKAAIFVLPYPTRAGLVAAGTPSEQITDAARAALDTIFMSAAGQLADAVAAGCIPLMIGHINVGGSITSSGQPNIGREIEMDPTLFTRLAGCCWYIGLNHIHRAQFVAGARYAGSVCRLDWGEIEQKEYLVLIAGKGDEMAEGATDEDGWLFRVEHMPIDVAPMYHVEGTLTREGFDWRIHYDGETFPGTVMRYPPDSEESGFAGAEVRVRYRFAAAEKPALNFDLVTAPFAGAKRLVLDPIAEHTRAIRAPEIVQARSLSEKVQAFVVSSGVVWSPSLEQKLALLQQPDGGAFLTALEFDLSGTVTGAGADLDRLPDAAAVPDIHPAEVLQ
jgi:DNA repair exonuclease SbcCD nuclease subunit